MKSGIIIEGITKEDLMSQFQLLIQEVRDLKDKVDNNLRSDVTLTELASMKGYNKSHMHRLVGKKHIPFWYDGREMVISREDAGKLKPKTTAQ